jgi:hypothetical protein
MEPWEDFIARQAEYMRLLVEEARYLPIPPHFTKGMEAYAQHLASDAGKVKPQLSPELLAELRGIR